MCLSVASGGPCYYCGRVVGNLYICIFHVSLLFMNRLRKTESVLFFTFLTSYGPPISEFVYVDVQNSINRSLTGYHKPVSNDAAHLHTFCP